MFEVRCQNCGRGFKRPDGPADPPHVEGAARVAGWTVWEGRTIGGTETRRVYCPNCAGREREDVDAPVGFDATCWTCMEDASGDWGYWDWVNRSQVRQLTEAEAREWAEQHKCEPDVKVTEPKKTAAAAGVTAGSIW